MTGFFFLPHGSIFYVHTVYFYAQHQCQPFMDSSNRSSIGYYRRILQTTNNIKVLVTVNNHFICSLFFGIKVIGDS